MTPQQPGGVPAQTAELHPAGKLKGSTAQTLVGDTAPVLQDPGNVSPDTNHTFSLLSRLSLLPGDGSRSGGMKASRITDVLVALYL